MTMLSANHVHPLESASAGRPDSAPAPGFVTAAPRFLLRAEGATVLAAALWAYAQLGGGSALFAALFLLPDLGLLGYLAGPRAGAITYNATHSYVGPGLLALLGLAQPALLAFAAIWAAHIGFDRMLGYGLKYGAAFQDTHLGRVGRAGLSSAPRPSARRSTGA